MSHNNNIWYSITWTELQLTSWTVVIFHGQVRSIPLDCGISFHIYIFEPFFRTLLHLLRLWEDHVSIVPLTKANSRSVSNAIQNLCYNVNPHTSSCIGKGSLVSKNIGWISLVKWLIHSPGQVPYCIARRWQTNPGRQLSLLNHVWNAPWLPPRLVLLHPVLF